MPIVCPANSGTSGRTSTSGAPERVEPLLGPGDVRASTELIRERWRSPEHDRAVYALADAREPLLAKSGSGCGAEAKTASSALRNPRTAKDRLHHRRGVRFSKR